MLKTRPEQPAKSILTTTTDNMIFVFGSNEAGIHGAGAARFAHDKKGAIYGQGLGRAGMSYAIPTKDHRIEPLPLWKIRDYVDAFITYARAHPNLKFQVTCVGCGLAGFTDRQIAPMFNDAPDNCYFDLMWQPHLSGHREFWGTF